MLKSSSSKSAMSNAFCTPRRNRWLSFLVRSDCSCSAIRSRMPEQLPTERQHRRRGSTSPDDHDDHDGLCRELPGIEAVIEQASPHCPRAVVPDHEAEHCPRHVSGDARPRRDAAEQRPPGIVDRSAHGFCYRPLTAVGLTVCEHGQLADGPDRSPLGGSSANGDSVSAASTSDSSSHACRHDASVASDHEARHSSAAAIHARPSIAKLGAVSDFGHASPTSRGSLGEEARS